MGSDVSFARAGDVHFGIVNPDEITPVFFGNAEQFSLGGRHYRERSHEAAGISFSGYSER